MRTRHRIPSIFNLSMVDVLCCALGCVILLWLINVHGAQQQTEENARTEEELKSARKDLDEAKAEWEKYRTGFGEKTRAVEDLEKKLKDAEVRLAELEKGESSALLKRKYQAG